MSNSKRYDLPAFKVDGLRELHFSNTRLESLDLSFNLGNLVELYLNGNNIKDLTHLRITPHLRILSLINNEIESVNGINFHNLRILNLSSNKITEINSLDVCKLEELILNDNSIHDILSLNVKELKVLKLQYNPIEKVLGFNPKGLTKLLLDCSFDEKIIDRLRNHMRDKTTKSARK